MCKALAFLLNSEAKPMKGRIKKLSVLAAVFVAVLMLFLVVEHFRGSWALNHRLNELKARGEVLTVAPLLPKPVEPDRNAFLVLATLTNRAEGILTNLSQAAPSMQFVEPGKALVVWQQDSWQPDAKTTNDWNRFGPQLKDARKLISLLHSAAAKPEYDCGFDYGKGFLDFQIGPLVTSKQAIQVLTAAMMDDLRNKRMDDAHTNVCALVKLAVMQQPEPLVICQLVRYACATLAFNATWQALQSPDWTDQQLAALQLIWAHADFPTDLGRSMEMERAMAIKYSEQLRGSKTNLDFALRQKESVVEIVGTEFGSLPTHGFVLHWLHAPIWRFAWAAQDQLRSLNRWQVMIERERFARSNSWSSLSAGDGPSDDEYFATLLVGNSPDLNWYDQARYLFSSDAFSINDVLIRKSLSAQTMQQLVVSALAVERFRKASGTLPNDLSVLVPTYISEPPKDWMDGKALRYLRSSNAGFQLYSVGEDGADDGGDSSLGKEKKSFRQIWDGKDAVWPAATVRMPAP